MYIVLHVVLHIHSDVQMIFRLLIILKYNCNKFYDPTCFKCLNEVKLNKN